MRSKEEIYLTLADFFKFPTDELYNELTNGLIEARLQELFQLAGFSYPAGDLTKGFTSYSKMKESYVQCFLGVNAQYASPIESVYKVWTTDKSASMAMANEKGYIFGDAALHMRHLFEQFALEIPKEYSSMPDHLTLQLEFLAFLIERNLDKQVYQFIVDHLDWLVDFKKELSSIANSSFYLVITDLVISAVEQELTFLEKELTVK